MKRIAISIIAAAFALAAGSSFAKEAPTAKATTTHSTHAKSSKHSAKKGAAKHTASKKAHKAAAAS
jgi:hypothetical protein